MNIMQILRKIRLFFNFDDEVFYINGSETLPPPLTKSEEAEIMQRITDGDNSAREELITHNLRLVVYIAKKYDSPSASAEDLISIGTIGLIKSGKNIFTRKKHKTCYICFTLYWKWNTDVPAKILSIENEVSIDEPLNTDLDGNELLLCDILGSDPDLVNKDIENELEKRLVLQAVSKLNQRECLIMELRFGLNGRKEHTQKQVADKLGISQSYISRLEKKIIRRLKHELEKAV